MPGERDPLPGEEDAPAHARQVAHGIERLLTAWRSAQWREARAGGLRPAQGSCLVALEKLGGSARMSELAEELGVVPASATAVVAPLVRRGLLARGRDPEDRRSVVVSLTPEGRRAARRWGGAPRALLEVIESLPEEEVRALRSALLGIVERLIDEGLVARARMCPTCIYFERDAHPGEEAPHHCRFVDRPLRGSDLRIECPDHVAGDAAVEPSGED